MNTNSSSQIPENVLKCSPEVQQSVAKYLEQLNDKEQIAYLIAKEHLGTSFDIMKSIGYITWKKTQLGS
jgi:hypothetical protein